MTFLKQAPEVGFKPGQITQIASVLEGKLERLEGVVEAEHPNRGGDLPSRPQDGERVGGRPEANVPDDEFALKAPEPLDQAELANIERPGLRCRTDDRMEGLVMGQGMDAMSAAGQFDESVAGETRHWYPKSNWPLMLVKPARWRHHEKSRNPAGSKVGTTG